MTVHQGVHPSLDRALQVRRDRMLGKRLRERPMLTKHDHMLKMRAGC